MHDRPVVLVTGASRGLGRATALILAEMGASLVLMARSAEALQDCAKEAEGHGAEVVWKAYDIGEPEPSHQLVEAAVNRFGRLDAVIHNAGVIDPIAPIARAEAGEWLKAYRINVAGAFHLTQAALPALREAGGRVITVGTGASTQPLSGWSAYCTTKAALLMFTRVLATEEPQITSLSMTPGIVDTGMQGRIRERGPENMPPELAASFQSYYESGMLEKVEVPARSLALLALKAPPEWTGAEVAHNDPKVAGL